MLDQFPGDLTSLAEETNKNSYSPIRPSRHMHVFVLAMSLPWWPFPLRSISQFFAAGPVQNLGGDWPADCLHHPSGVGIDGVVKIFRLIYFSVMC